jgi:hypothetical protein
LLPNGIQVRGAFIVSAVARLEKPGLTVEKAIQALGGEAKVLQILKRDYLNVHPWDRAEESLKEALEHILHHHLGGDPHRISTSPRFMEAYFSLPDGTRVSGRQVVFAVARFERPGLTNEEAFKELGGGANIIQLLKEKYLGVVFFPSLSQNELITFIRNAGLEEIINHFADDPLLLAEALRFLKAKEFQNRDVIEFVKRYVGLQVEQGHHWRENRDEEKWDRRRLYILAILKALEAGEALDLSEGNFNLQLGNLIRLSRKAFEEEPKKLIQELETQATDRSLHPFVRRLHSEAATYFKATRDFELKGMRTEPYAYQKEGAHFLTTHDRAILADEAGMGKSYQVIAAAESLGLRRVLWVTTAANKETLKGEILEHSFAKERDVQIVISGDPAERKKQIETLNGQRYVITNYETLVALQKSDPEGYKKLTQGLDVVVVDEAQLTDNPETLRTRAIHEIPSPRRWLITATPYQNKADSIWTLLNWLYPERYPDHQGFRRMYTESTQGLLLLHSELKDIMLRRTKQDTLSYFLPEEAMPFSEQLKSGIPRLPRKVRVPPEQRGTYPLSLEQADLIAWMIADFNGWAGHFNENLPNGAEPIDLETVNPLFKFGMIQKVIYEPEYFGIETENPIFKALDQTVARRLARGEKVILWCWNTAMIDALEKRYGKLGVRRIDGNVRGAPRESARKDFQTDPNVRILVGNYLSGGVGLTLTAAHSAIFVQLPDRYPLLYQAEGRHQRLIGLNNLQHAKEQVEVEWMVPRFPEGFVESIEDPKLREILFHGTLVEQTRARLEGGEILYNLTMEGYGDLDELEKYFKEGVIKGMGLDRGEKLDYVSHLKGETRTYAEVIRDLMPLWKLVEGNPQAEDRVLHLIERFKEYPAFAKKIGQVFRETSQTFQEDLEFLLSLFEIRNKYIREQIFERVPDLLANIYGEGKSLAEVVQGLKIGRLTPAAFVAQIYLRGGAKGEVIQDITRELSQMRDIPLKRYIEDHYFMGLFGMLGGIIGNNAAETILSEKGPLFTGVKLEDRIHAIYRLGLLSRTRNDLLEKLRGESFDSWVAFFNALERAVNQAIAEFAGRSAEQVEEMIRSNPLWRGNADPLLALIAGYQSFDEQLLLDQFGEVLRHLFDGDYREWRYGENNRHHGNSIDYLKDSPEFWNRYSKNDVTKIDRVTVSAQKIKGNLFNDYMTILQEWNQEGESVEGKWVKEQIEAYRGMEGKGREERLQEYQKEIRLLGTILSKNEVTEETKAVLAKYGLKYDDSVVAKTELRHKLEEIRNLVSWMILDNGFRSLSQGDSVDKQALIRELESKAKFYRARKHEKMAEHIETLKEILVQWTAGDLSFKDVTIEDTDDPAILTRMGALHPEMTNCFNPNGNPTQNQFVTCALGSKNMKMVVVREQGKIIAIAMMKVKQLEENGEPVLFLERGLYRKGYNFRNEMLAHLLKKAQMNPKPIVMDEVRGKHKDSDPYVLGIGAYTELEYVEPVFALRRSRNNVRHPGRIVTMKDLEPKSVVTAGDTREGPTMPAVGIGTSNKPLKAYIAELKAKGVKVVVDIRAYPRSQRYPHFNRDPLSEALQKAGIEYIWMGETLGNPKDSKGERTLEGFKRYMGTEDYEKGISRLMEIIGSREGMVAITCAEGNEEECHRKFVLEDLKKRKG